MRTQSKIHNRQEEQVASVLLVPGFVSTCSRPLHLGQRGGRDAGSNIGTRLPMITGPMRGPLHSQTGPATGQLSGPLWVCLTPHVPQLQGDRAGEEEEGEPEWNRDT